jgi:ketosteroid isomerase-like protein
MEARVRNLVGADAPSGRANISSTVACTGHRIPRKLQYLTNSLKLYSRYMIRHIASAILFLLISPALQPQIRPTAAQSEVRDVLATFVQAFDDLDWEVFRSAFSDDATVFYPRAFPERANGRAEFEKTFRIVFDQIRDGKTQAPFTDIQPKDLKVQIFGNVAIASFLLDDRAGFLNRRTIVLNKTKASWKIVHLHASEVACTKP